MLKRAEIGASKIVLIASLIGGLTACGSDSKSDNTAGSDEQLRSLIAEQQLTGDPSGGRTLPAVTDAKAVLGMELFFSLSLGGDLDSACVSCHHPALGGGDDLSLPIGVGADNPHLLGPGRTHESGKRTPTVPRNAPTTFNIALWDKTLFWDGRVESLGKTPLKNGGDGLGIRTPDSALNEADAKAGENLTAAQARFPVTSAAEMRGHSYAIGDNATLRARLESRLQNTGLSAGEITVDPDGDSLNNWVQAFEAVYEPTIPAENIITFDRVADAIAAYENSQVFVNTPWKNYVEGNVDALSEAQKRGAILFFSSVEKGGAGCASCHSGDFFTDESFHVIAMPQIGEGKGDGPKGTDDFGRMRETGELSDQYAFRTPTLLNVEHTGPYGHAGAYETLNEVIKHHLQPALSIGDFFASGGNCSSMRQLSAEQTCESISGNDAEINTRLALAKLEMDQQAGTSALVNAQLAETQVNDLESFLLALTDPCLEDSGCIGQWIPQGADTIDQNRIIAVDEFNSSLLKN